jgi:hypothetical protein
MILDTNDRITAEKARELKAAGVVTVIRYQACETSDPDKVVTTAEALGLVYEVGVHPSGAEVGRRDGEWASNHAPSVGAPGDGSVIIYYAVDYDARHGDMPGIEQAFRAFREACSPGFRVGCYGSGFCCDTLFDQKLIDARWITQSSGFDGSKESINSGRWEMHQGPEEKFHGLDIDTDVRRTPETDIGDFVPFASAATPPVVAKAGGARLGSADVATVTATLQQAADASGYGAFISAAVVAQMAEQVVADLNTAHAGKTA